MTKPSRQYVPCRRCGAIHRNPASSSLCNECGKLEALENLQHKAEMDALDAEIAANYEK